MTIENAMRTYRLPKITTTEDLESRWSCTVRFGEKILLAGYYYSGKGKPCYFGAVYTFTTKDHTCEGEIKLTAVSEEMYEDNGHALQWGMTE